MSVESVKQFFSIHAPEYVVLESESSTATVKEAAETYKVEPGQIAKTLSFRLGDECILIVVKGDARIDNKKYKNQFGTKARMLGLEEVEAETGHPVGGVCPFGLSKPLRIYLDISLKVYDELIPAAGGPRAAVKISPDKIAELTSGEWVDVCQTV